MQPADDEQNWKIEAYKSKLRYSLSARFFLKFHVSLILFFTILTGWLVDIALLNIGVGAMMVRYPLAIVCAYGVFLFGVHVWIEYSGIREFIKYRRAQELVGDDVPSEPYKEAGWGLLDPSIATVGGEGCFIWLALVFALMVAYFFFGGFLITGAASFFSEVVLELLLAAGLLRGIRRIESSGWVLGVMNYTFWPLIFSITVSVVVGWVMHKSWPAARTLPEAWAAYQAAKVVPKRGVSLR